MPLSSFVNYFNSKRETLRTLDRLEIFELIFLCTELRWPSGLGVGLEIHWDIPAQVRILLAASDREFLHMLGRFLCLKIRRSLKQRLLLRWSPFF